MLVEVEAEGTPCTRVGRVTQTRRGNEIDVHIESYWTQEHCVLLAVRLHHTVRFEGPLAPGDYVVRVNGLEVAFRI